MLTALIFATVSLRPTFQDAQNTQTFTDRQLGLSFAHPTDWIQEKPNPPAKDAKPKGKTKPDGTVHFRIPLTGAADDAELQIMRASFTGTPDTWQQLQTQTNADLHRQVERQWQQEILGVPLLLTQINYSDNGVSRTTLTGLLYNDTDSKLLFRLTGPSGDFDKAEYAFDQAMQTLRTTNNELPKTQDPNGSTKKVAKPDDRGTKHMLFPPAPSPKPVLAPVSIPLVVSTKSVELRVPKGWSGGEIDGATLQLHGEGLSYPVKIRLASVLDSDPPNNALVAATGDSLKDFTTVIRREDSRPDVNGGGCLVVSVWRTGTGASGPLVTMDAGGACGDFYFVASCRPVPGSTLSAQRKLLEELLQAISIQAVP